MKHSKSNSKKLKIAVTFDFCETHGYFLKPDVVKSLRSLGAEVIPLLYDESRISEVLKDVDGVMIPGGVGDVDPQLYGQKKKFQNVKISRERCDFEFRLLEKYLPMEKPLLAICWGLQLVNVFLGGSLIQDIESEREAKKLSPSKIRHEQEEAKHLPTHWIDFKPKSSAIKLVGAEKLFVNSTHHQAIDQLAKGLKAEAYSPDGLVECFTMNDHAFALGVQWHPERLSDDVIIPAFLKAAQRLRS
ncbi:MAG: glutamine amidotransferase [Bacteriovoracaceae bacterium]|nr:glutamine amidotransferase [Bacteriovoracaceae bacterium]